MFGRLMERVKQKDYRRLVAWTLAGKVLGVIALILIVKGISAYVFHPAFADDSSAPSAVAGAAAAAAPSSAAPPDPPYVNPVVSGKLSLRLMRPRGCSSGAVRRGATGRRHTGRAASHAGALCLSAGA